MNNNYHENRINPIKPGVSNYGTPMIFAIALAIVKVAQAVFVSLDNFFMRLYKSNHFVNSA